MVSPWVSLYYCAHYVEGDTEAYSDELAKDTQPVRGRAQTKPIPYLPAPLSICQRPFGCLSRLLRNPHPLRQARVFNHLNVPQGPLTVLSSSSQHPLTHASSLTRIRRGQSPGIPPSLPLLLQPVDHQGLRMRLQIFQISPLHLRCHGSEPHLADMFSTVC